MSLSPNSGPNPWAVEARATLALGWPIVLTNLAQIAIGTTDTVMMGWLGPSGLAAGSLGGNLYFAFFILGIGLAMGTAPMLAHSLGRRRHSVRQCRRIVRHGLYLCVLYSVPVWLVMWQAESILLLLGQDPVLAAHAQDYVHAMQWGLLPALGVVVLRAFIAALERPKAGLVVTIGAVVLNAFANWLLMFGNWGAPAMGVAGAGVASTLSNSFMFLALLGFILWDRRFRRYHLLGAFWRGDWALFKELLHIGTPMGLAMGFEITGFNAAAFLMGLLGTNALAAHAIALQIASATFMVPLGLGQAATVRVGLAAGAGNAQGVRRAGWVALGLGTGFMAVMALMLLGMPYPLIDAFLDLSDPATHPVVAHAITFLAVAGIFQIADGAQVVGAGVLRGLKDTRMPMLFAGLGYWLIAIPLGAVLAFPVGMGGLGIWVSLAVGLGVVAALMVSRWSRREKLGLLARSHAGA